MFSKFVLLLVQKQWLEYQYHFRITFSAKYKYEIPISAQVTALPFLCQALLPAGRALQNSIAHKSSSVLPSVETLVMYASVASRNGAPYFANSVLKFTFHLSCPPSSSTSK